MAKKTNAQLQAEIKELSTKLRHAEEKEQLAQKQLKESYEMYDNALNSIGDMLNDQGFEIIGAYFGNVKQERKKTTLKEIAFKVGKLVVIKNEYEDLKDRTLPVPKMKVLQDERNFNSNNRRM